MDVGVVSEESSELELELELSAFAGLGVITGACTPTSRDGLRDVLDSFFFDNFYLLILLFSF